MIDSTTAYERQPISGATIDDLNLNLVREHLQVAIKRREYYGPTDPIEYLLQHSAVIEGPGGVLTPTMAGVLAFAREPERWISANGIDLAQFSSNQPHSANLIFSKQVRGNLDILIERSVELLWARSEHRYRLEGAERIEEHAYSQVVLRELTVNAIAHRDWSRSESRVRIQMFPDRIEWLTPGGLPPGVTIANLREEQVSRNPILVQILYQAGKVESFGMGIDTVEDTLRASRSRPLYVHDNGRRVLFCVYGRILATRRAASSQAPLTNRASSILALIDQRGPVSISDLEDALEGSRRTLQYELRKLIDSGVLIARGETNNRRYRRPNGISAQVEI